MTRLLTSILHPQYLNSNYKTKLLDVYKTDYENKSDEDGYIIKVNSIKRILSSDIDNNNQIIVKSYCNCDIFKPEVGSIIDCTINLIHINGIFLNKYGIKIIVPSSNDYQYSQSKIIYNNKHYIVGDTITIKIIDVRYDKFTYSCVGNLILKT